MQTSSIRVIQETFDSGNPKWIVRTSNKDYIVSADVPMKYEGCFAIRRDVEIAEVHGLNAAYVLCWLESWEVSPLEKENVFRVVQTTTPVWLIPPKGDNYGKR